MVVSHMEKQHMLLIPEPPLQPVNRMFLRQRLQREIHKPCGCTLLPAFINKVLLKHHHAHSSVLFLVVAIAVVVTAAAAAVVASAVVTAVVVTAAVVAAAAALFMPVEWS